LPQIWVLAVAVVFIGGLIINSISSTNKEETAKKERKAKLANSKKASSKAESASESKKEAAEESSIAASYSAADASSEAADKDPNSYNTGTTYEQLARTPDDYKNKKIKFTGRVVQVIEDSTDTQLRLAVDGDSDNMILVDFDPDILNGSRVLEDDLITVSGISLGTTTYESTMGGNITIPAMTGKIIDNQGKASDDYGY
jgi:hypothetical protein